ncbi:lipid A export permease/ATP-binding protein MsbA [Marinimicrobium sp. ABcell2]|uniref:lipid A export permease/ATP-binding protein MsbA n=1 Tax=Marinimicrobium sp. ABcell2 TaxID=3069751 RepID=UPI0027B0DDE4|nr:lipid A export permease/ATP-binding protein MsbA [Marinimicrobium sp. ABcell2]MDQ2076527.1 lipid A export permease/ATP-binding protein MsbA [Marinimicrobium sp. ABcell2]
MSEPAPTPLTDEVRQTDAASLKVYLRLLGYLKPYWGIFSLSILGFVIYSAAQPAMAQFMEYLLDFINERDAGPAYMPSLIIMGIVLVRSLGAFVGNYFISRVSFGVVHTLRLQLFNHMTTLPGDYFDSHSSGHLMSVITYNVNGVTTAASDALKTLVREGATVLALLVYLLYKDWMLTLLLLLVTPLIAVLVGYVGKRLRRLSAQVQHSMGDITQVSSEMINGYRVMRSFGGEGYERRRFAEASWRNYLQNMKIVLTASLNTPILQMLVAVAMGLLLWVALSIMEIESPGAFVAYFIAAGMILKPMRQLSEVVPTIQKGVAAADSIFQLLDEPPERDTGEYRVERVKGAVRFEQLSFGYGRDDQLALKDISLDVKPGEVVALVGRSGSGKTTLVSLLGRFYDPTSGQICLDGVPLSDYALDNLRQQIALVNQNVILFNDTVAGNIAYGALAGTDFEAIRRAADAANATEFIEQLPNGFDTMIGESGTRLSGGQRQRLAIARAILKDAPILILDEATSALDTESERYIQSALEYVMRGRTTFVVAHRLSTVESADRIVVMGEGRILEQGSHQELLAAGGQYARLHALQFRDEPTPDVDDSGA